MCSFSCISNHSETYVVEPVRVIVVGTVFLASVASACCTLKEVNRAQHQHRDVRRRRATAPVRPMDNSWAQRAVLRLLLLNTVTSQVPLAPCKHCKDHFYYPATAVPYASNMPSPRWPLRQDCAPQPPPATIGNTTM